VPAGQNYLVYVNNSQTALSGYTATNPTTDHLGFRNVAADTAYLTADFGFRNTSTYTITDRVWYDANDDGSASGESGIAGVTVDLLDNSGNVIATTTSDAGGNVTFSGMANGTYQLRVTDRANKLGDYYGTTTYAQNALRTGIIVNGGDVTNTSFGYDVSRAIGDTVFNDIGGTYGVQDAGEPGISGVTVLLYRDANGNGTFEPGTDTLVGTLTTDASGHYLFTGLTSGTYWVSIDRTQTALSGFTTLTTGDDVPAQTGDQRLVTTLSNLNIDYGYRAANSSSISGTLWNDVNNNGTDDSEAGLANVTIQLLQGGIVVGTATTDSNGNYSFSGLPAGTYTVKVTDSNGVLVGYNTTYEKTAPYDGQETVILASNSAVSNVNFGYYKPQPTLASISAFRARVEQGQVVVEWETDFEMGTVGFYLERRDGTTGRFARISTGLLPSVLEPQGGVYDFVDATAFSGGTYVYRLIEVEASGDERKYGPFTVTVASAPPQGTEAGASELATAKYFRKGREVSAEKKVRIEAAQSAHDLARAKRAARFGQAVKLQVAESGLYRLSSADLAGLLGVKEKDARRWIQLGSLGLSNRGVAVPYYASADSSSLYFYGQAPDGPYARENVYWLKAASGTPMAVVPAARGRVPQPTGAEFYMRTLRLEENLTPVLAIDVFEPEDDFWMWTSFFAGAPGLDSQDFVLSTPFTTHVGSARLHVRLLGVTDTAADPDHHVEVWLNDTFLGEQSWDGKTFSDLDLTFDAALLVAGDNTLRIKALLDTGVPYSIFYLDYVELTYPSLYETADNELTFTDGGNLALEIGGFTEAKIHLLDITDPKVPALTTGEVVQAGPTDYRLIVRPKASGRRYLAVAESAVSRVDNSWVDVASDLHKKDYRVDYLVIAPEELSLGAAQLAAYRQAAGFSTLVVNLENVMDEFNFGISSPWAIRDFLAYAWAKWKKPPSYVVLVGEGTYDYKDYLGLGDNLLPVAMVRSPFGLVASDNRLADVAGNDGVPDMAIGRIPAVSEDELAGYLGKLRAHEAALSGQWSSKVLLIADRADDAGNFPQDSHGLVALVSPDRPVEEIYLPPYSADAARQRIIDAINEGVGLVNYIGHGSTEFLSNEHIFSKADIEALLNADKTPVMLFLTCAAGIFELPGYDSLTETLVLRPDRGAVATWAPTGLSVNDDAVRLNREFFRRHFAMGDRRLGPAAIKALRAAAPLNSWTNELDIYNVLGDPAALVR
jgi:hypothetical protein